MLLLISFLISEKVSSAQRRSRDAEAQRKKKTAASLLAVLRRKSLSLHALRLCADEIQILRMEKVVSNRTQTRKRKPCLTH